MLLIKNAHVVTVNASDDTITRGAILIDGKRIIALGDSLQLEAAHPGVEHYDAKGQVVMPGMVDSHNHPFNYLVAGHGDDLEIKTLLNKVFYPFEKHVSEEETYIGALATFSEMIRSGVTCFNDAGGYMPDAVARAAQDIGIRGVITRSTRDIYRGELAGTSPESTEQALQSAVDVVERWHGAAEGRLKASFGIRLSITASDELIREIGALSRAYKVGIHTHAATAAFEKEASLAFFGKRTLDRYRDLDMLGNNVCAVHMGFLDDDEIPLVAESGLKVAHCVVAASIGAWGIIKGGRIPELMQRGVNVSIGSDTNFGAGTLDMFRQMFVCATVHRETHGNPALIGALETLRMATINGAKTVLWDDEIGSLEVGKKADLVLLDNSKVEWGYPGRDVFRTLVYSGSRGDVDAVMIAGAWVMRSGQILTMNLDNLKQDVALAGEAWWARSLDAEAKSV